MRGRTGAEAIVAYAEYVQLVLSCVTREIIGPSGYHASAESLALILNRNEAVALRSVPPIALRSTEHYRFVEDSGARTDERVRVEIAGYAYALEQAGTRAELLAFHWHPHVPGVRFPHLHVGSAATSHSQIVTSHIPSGFVMLADVLYLAVSGFGVRPLRNDWESILHPDRRSAPEPLRG